MTWYALLTTSGQELKATRYLSRRDYEFYWPHFHIRGKWRGHKSRDVVRAALPGYAFLAAERPDWRRVLEAPGIRDVMRDGDERPFTLSEGDMQKVRNIDAGVNSSPVNAERGIPYRVGQRVRLVHNLWENWETTILAIDKAGKLSIEVPLLGGKHVARVTAADVEAV